MGDADYLYVFHHIVMPIAMEFSPELVFGNYLPALGTHSLIPSQYPQDSMLQMGTTLENVTSHLQDMLI